MSHQAFFRFSLFTLCFAFCVVIMGAYVRLSDAGLGCPDWPGCYGKFLVPSAEHVEQAFPQSSFEAHKAWKEMIHRYLAEALGLLVVINAILSWVKFRTSKTFWSSLFLVLLVLFQAFLGLRTVTDQLHPMIVMGHLLGGFSILAFLTWFSLQRYQDLRTIPISLSSENISSLKRLKPWIFIGFVFLVLQISLGGWMSANYASLACPDFPTCQGRLWPSTNFPEAFDLLREFGVNYEGGLLDNESRMTIHVIHRFWAFAVFFYLGGLAFKIYKIGKGSILGKLALFLIFLLIDQMALGISNVIFGLPLPIAVAHNGIGALLLCAFVAIYYFLEPRSQQLKPAS